MTNRGPCPPECPERSPMCHTTCKTYLAHRAEREAVYRERERDVVTLSVLIDGKRKFRTVRNAKKRH